MGLIVLKYRIFCPFSAKMQDEGFNFFMLSPAKMEWIENEDLIPKTQKRRPPLKITYKYLETGISTLLDV